MKMTITSSSGSGTLPSNTITNPKEDLKGITTRSGTAYQRPTIPTSSSSLPPVVERETKTTKDTVYPTNNESTNDVQPPVVQTESPILNSEPVISPIIEPVASPDLIFNISFANALILMPKLGPTIKTLLTNKDKLCELARTLLNEHYSAVLLKKLSEKLGDPHKFLIPCDFPGMAECLARADLGARINLMPLYVWNKLSLPNLSPTCMTLELADRSSSCPIGVAEDVFVKVGTFHFSVDFVVVDFDADPRVPLTLEIYFLKTESALIDVFEAKTDRSSIDEPPEVELKDLPSHLEYAFMKGDDKFPVIITKDLCVEEKTALITEKTTFTCPSGMFAYRRMPFGLCNAPGTFQRRSRTDPTLLKNYEMVAEGNGDLPIPDLRTMEELCQPSLNGRCGPIAPIAIQATNFGLKNDMIQQVQNSCQFHGLPGDDANKHLDKFLHVTQSIKQMAKMFLGKYFPPSMVTKLKNEITNFHQRLDESLFKAWECYKLSIARCPNHNMLPVTQIDTFYNGLTLRHRDTINVAAGGTFTKRRPEECYDLIENMTANHNDWNTSAKKSESSSSITSSSDTEIAALKAEMTKINKNLMRVLQVNQQVKAVAPSCETCGGPHSFFDCPATVGNTQNVYAAGAYQGNSYQPQGNHNLLIYHSDNFLEPPGFNQNQNRNNQNQNFHNQNRNKGNHNPQGNNQGSNQFFQGANQRQNQPPAYQAPSYHALVYQAPVHQP
nr:reverse transcriptase domain-containing protein [Tanacetum cinerariifolium]